MLALLGPAPSAFAAETLPPPDSWESDPETRPEMQHCTPLPAARIVPVAPAKRPGAVSRLRDAAIVPLTPKAAEELTTLPDGAAPHAAKPYLVRAVAKNENGAFSAQLCGDRLWITHGSLGHIVLPSIRAPVVVFLDRQPAGVYVDWSMPR